MKKIINKILEREQMFLRLYDNCPLPTFTFLRTLSTYELVFFNHAVPDSYREHLGSKCHKIFEEDIIHAIDSCYKTKKNVKILTTFEGNLARLTFVSTSKSLVSMYVENLTEVELAKVKLDLSEINYKDLEKSLHKLMDKVLTSREKEYLELLAQGKSRKDISEVMNVSTGTLDTLKHRIKVKIDADDIKDIAKWYYKCSN